MNQSEKEYQEFMMKLSKKANEVRRDFENLSEENKERIRNDVSYLAIIELLKNTKVIIKRRSGDDKTRIF